MVYKSWSALEKDINNSIAMATSAAQMDAALRLKEYMEYFYATPDPIEYNRTGHLGDSWRIGNYTTTPTGAIGEIYIDESDYYTTGTYETPWVFENAEVGRPESGMLGHPYFWENTMIDIEKEIIPNAFGRYFRRK